jgi:alkylation response protein AidB-like acyl-CoA dehydrogenase
MRLADRESVQIKLGEVAHQIQIGRLLVMHAAWKLDQGDRARKEVSMAKLHVADTLHQAADVAIQLNGATAIPRTRFSNGSIATPVRRASSTALPKCTTWCWRASCARRAATSGIGARGTGYERRGDAACLGKPNKCACAGRGQINTENNIVEKKSSQITGR